MGLIPVLELDEYCTNVSSALRSIQLKAFLGGGGFLRTKFLNLFFIYHTSDVINYAPNFVT